MLVLSRERDESIVIHLNREVLEKLLAKVDDQIDGEFEIKFTVVEIRGIKVRMGCNADKDIPVHREEVYEAIQREGARRTAAVM